MNLYLDVDGVLTPTPALLDSDFIDWVDAGFFSYSPAMVARLAVLPATLHWLTTWRDQANDVLCSRFGWSDLPVLERKREALWWKLEALTAHQRSDEPFIWIDDELDERRASSNGIVDAILERYRAPFLLISPSPRICLTPFDLIRIAEFVQLHG